MATSSALSGVVDIVSKLGPMFFGTPKTTTRTTSSSSPEAIGLNKNIANTALSNSTDPAVTDEVVNDIIRRSAEAFMPMRAVGNAAGAYNSSVMAMLANQAASRASTEASKAVLDYRTSQQQIAERAAGNLINGTRNSTQTANTDGILGSTAQDIMKIGGMALTAGKLLNSTGLVDFGKTFGDVKDFLGIGTKGTETLITGGKSVTTAIDAGKDAIDAVDAFEGAEAAADAASAAEFGADAVTAAEFGADAAVAAEGVSDAASVLGGYSTPWGLVWTAADMAFDAMGWESFPGMGDVLNVGIQNLPFIGQNGDDLGASASDMFDISLDVIGGGIGGPLGDLVGDASSDIVGDELGGFMGDVLGGGVGGLFDSILCGLFTMQGHIPKKWWFKNVRHFNNYYAAGKAGYYLWAIPLTKLINKKPDGLFARFVRKTFMIRAENIAAKFGCKDAKRSFLGEAIEFFLYELCDILAHTVVPFQKNPVYATTTRKVLNG